MAKFNVGDRVRCREERCPGDRSFELEVVVLVPGYVGVECESFGYVGIFPEEAVEKISQQCEKVLDIAIPIC
jgi:hypothetical protein